jgi:hypothetical protein
MSTSGTSSFNPAATAIVSMALRKLGVIAEDEEPTGGQYADTVLSLNALVKEWMATGVHVWAEEEAILFFQQGQARYLLGGTGIGGTGPDNCCDANSWVSMQVAAPIGPGATSVTVNSTTGYNGLTVNNGDNFGIVLDSGAAFWTTVSGAPVNNVVTFANPLPAGASASAQNNVFDYATKIVRPLKVPRSRTIYYQGGQNNGPRLTPMSVLSRKEYMDLPNPLNPGITTQFFYSPQLVSGEYYAWPTPQQANIGARFTWYRPLMDINTPANTVDFPQEWINALGWNLAKEMGPEFDCPPQRWAIILQESEKKLDLVQGFDRESEPIYFGMSYDEAQR